MVFTWVPTDPRPNPQMHRPCEECEHADLSMKRNPEEYYCRIAHSFQPRSINGVFINCNSFKEGIYEWDI